VSRYRKGAGGKRDENEPAIIEVLRAHGCVVWQLSGKGIPDLLALRKGKKWLADVKMPGKPTTKPQEDAWEEAATKANVSVFILRTPEDATKMLNDALAPWEPEARHAEEHRNRRCKCYPTNNPHDSKAAPPHSCKNCEGIQPETCLVNPHRTSRKGDAATARAEGRERIHRQHCSLNGCETGELCGVRASATGMGHTIRDQDPAWLKERVQRSTDAAKEAEVFAPPAVPACDHCGEAYDAKCYDRAAPPGAVSCTKDVHCIRYDGHDGECRTTGPRCCTTCA
jgi:hypothetical protein